MFWEEPSSASKVVKITNEQTFGLLLSNYYCPFLNCYCLPLRTCLTISAVIELRFKQNLWRWKGKTRGNKSHVLGRTQFCL
jgi:hypothetical protein